MKVGPLIVYGQLEIADEDDWWKGRIEGKLIIEEVVDVDFEPEYYAKRLRRIPKKDQE